jgi:hypothetical protein
MFKAQYFVRCSNHSHRLQIHSNRLLFRHKIVRRLCLNNLDQIRLFNHKDPLDLLHSLQDSLNLTLYLRRYQFYNHLKRTFYFIDHSSANFQSTTNFNIYSCPNNTASIPASPTSGASAWTSSIQTTSAKSGQHNCVTICTATTIQAIASFPTKQQFCPTTTTKYYFCYSATGDSPTKQFEDWK